MTQTEPTLAQLWDMIERDSQLTREHVQQALSDVRERLDTFVTKEVWEVEKRALERRLDEAESELQAQGQRHEALKERLASEARAAATSRRRETREFVYKGIIPALALLIAATSLYAGLS